MAFGVEPPKNSYMSMPFFMGITLALAISVVIFSIVVRFPAPAPVAPPPVMMASLKPEVKQVETVSVLVPTTDIRPGTPLETGMFRMDERPITEVPDDALRSLNDVQKGYAGGFMPARVPIVKEQISATRVANLITQRIPEGYRAVTVMVDMRSAVEGWVLPGARVDVVWTTTIGSDRTLKVIVQNAEVLSAERATEIQEKQPPSALAKNVGANTTPRTVTLLASASDAKKIHFASTVGVLSLSLRGDGDNDDAISSPSVTMNDMLGIKDKSKRVQARVAFSDDDGKKRTLTLVDDELKLGDTAHESGSESEAAEEMTEPQQESQGDISQGWLEKTKAGDEIRAQYIKKPVKRR